MGNSRFLIFVSVLLVICGAAVGVAASGALDQNNPLRVATAERARLLTQVEIRERAQRQPVVLAFQAGMVVVAVVGAAAAMVAGVRWMDRRARTIHADANGVLPALLLRPGEQVVDLGALAGPARATGEGVIYALPAEAIPRLQAAANTGAAVTRSMRALSTHRAGEREPGGPSLVQLGAGALFSALQQRTMPIQVLQGSDVDSHIVRLLDQGRDASGGAPQNETW